MWNTYANISWRATFYAKDEYKIGKTINIDQRVYQFGILFPEKPKVVHQIETNHIDYAESHWHRRFAHKRVNGEWFSLVPADVEEFCNCTQMSFSLQYQADFFALVRCAFASPILSKEAEAGGARKGDNAG